TTSCACCNKAGPRDRFAWMAHLDFCRDCIRSFVVSGWAVAKEGAKYTCTQAGWGRFPGLGVVSHCPVDGMPIYRRWVEGGIATAQAWPYCLGQEGQMTNYRGLGG